MEINETSGLRGRVLAKQLPFLSLDCKRKLFIKFEELALQGLPCPELINEGPQISDLCSLATVPTSSVGVSRLE